MEIPENLRFTRDHEWVRDEGDGTVVIGITAYAQDALGDIVYFEAPEPGDEVDSGSECGVIESVKAASDVYAPVSGEVVEVNEAAVDSPEIINESPYGDGWLVKIALSEPAELAELMDAEAYAHFLETA